jgi:aldehyde dehydrogenase (NAD+)
VFNVVVCKDQCSSPSPVYAVYAGLALEPLSGALAAGNAVVLKPSELAPSTAAFIAANIPRYLDSEAVKVVLGAPEVGEKLMEQRWDKVLFIGNWYSSPSSLGS